MKRNEAGGGACDDASLIRRARDGDVAAFRALYDVHVGRVHSLSLRLMQNHAEAEELTQDVFVAAWRRLDRFRGDARFSTWLHSIAVRMSRQRLRGLVRRWRREDAHAWSSTNREAPALPSDVDLERGLASLPPRMRTALVLHAIEGYTQAETAALMGIAEGTVKAHVHRARQLLHERMDYHGSSVEETASGTE